MKCINCGSQDIMYISSLSKLARVWDYFCWNCEEGFKSKLTECVYCGELEAKEVGDKFKCSWCGKTFRFPFQLSFSFMENL